MIAVYILLQRNTRPKSTHNPEHSEAKSKNELNNVSFSDVSKIALVIKEILPETSFEVIKEHILKASSIDVDTIMTSILDSNNSANAPSTSLNTSSKPQPTSAAAHPQHLSYEKRKFILLNEARQRYLAKHLNE